MENIQISPDELQAEQEALKEAKEEEIRECVISDFGFDEIDDAERIEKLVAKEIKSHKDLSTAIGQKINYRTELQKKSDKPPVENKEKSLTPEEIDQKLDEKLNERLEKRDLDSMDYSDEVKAEISRVAKIQGVSVKQAVLDPYIASKIEAENKERTTNEAGISRVNKSGGKVGFSIDNPPEIDYSTPEKKAETEKKYDEWKTWMKTQPGYGNPI